MRVRVMVRISQMAWNQAIAAHCQRVQRSVLKKWALKRE
jgi:hypothetical protein